MHIYCVKAATTICRGLLLHIAALPPRHPQASVAEEDNEDENAGASYQLDMMRCLREVNVDNNTVGW